MRVISGSARGVKLETIDGLDTRPTTDRIKESMYNLIQFNIQNANVLDLFSGSGALGIEAASRGAKLVSLVEKNNRCYKCIESNIVRTKLEKKINIIKSDVISALMRTTEKYDVIIMDPPYKKDLVGPVLNAIESNSILNEDGIIVIEHSIDDFFDDEIGIFKRVKHKKYGKTFISIYE